MAREYRVVIAGITDKRTAEILLDIIERNIDKEIYTIYLQQDTNEDYGDN